MGWQHAANVSTAMDLAGRINTFMTTGEFQFTDATNGEVLKLLEKLFGQLSNEIAALGVEITERDRAQELITAVHDTRAALSTLLKFGDFDESSILPTLEQQQTALNAAEVSLDTLFELIDLWLADEPSPELVLSMISTVTSATIVRIQTVEAFGNGAFGRDSVSDDILQSAEFLINSDQIMRDTLTFPMHFGALHEFLAFTYPDNPDHVPPEIYRAALEGVIRFLSPDTDFHRILNADWDEYRFFDPGNPLNFDTTSATLLPTPWFDPEFIQNFKDRRPWDYETMGSLPTHPLDIFFLSSAQKAVLDAEWAWLSEYVDMAVSHQLMLEYDAYTTTNQARSTAYTAFAPLTFGNHYQGENDVDDNFNGTIHRDFMNGGGGNDTFQLHDGANLVLGGTGNDTIYGGAGSDRLYGGDDDDSIEGNSGFNRIFGEAGEDTLIGGYENDVIDGGADDDSIDGWLGNDDLSGGTGNDTVQGGDGDDTLKGGSGHDELYGGRGNDEIDGGEGDDLIVVEPTDDDFNEVAIYGHRPGGLGEGGEGNDTLRGGVGQDTLKGDDDNDSLFGGAGNDLLEGGAGDDTLVGDLGDDTLDGGTGTGDVAELWGYRSDYILTDIGGGSLTVEYTGVLEPYYGGTDTLTGIEQVQFRDGTYGLSDLVNDAPIAVDDTANVAVPVYIGDNYGARGDVLSNDTDLDLPFGDSLRVSGVRRGGETDTSFGDIRAFGTPITPIRQYTHADGEVDNGIIVQGALGNLWISDDGAFTYHARSSADVTGIETDVFTYEITDVQGVTDTAEIVVNVAHTNAPHSGFVEVTGATTEGSTLTAVSHLQDRDGLGPLSYQWQYYEFDPVTQTSVTTDIAGATSSTYTLGAADVGHTIFVLVSFIDGKGTTESRSGYGGFISNVNDSPTGDVTISGNPTQGQTLAAVSTLADGDGLGAFNYQWMRDGDEIEGGTSETYTLGQEDVGAAMSVRISYTDQQGTLERVTSTVTASVSNINDAPTGAAAIVGTATEDETLAAVSTIEDEDGLGDLSYQWLRNGQDITDATNANYTLGQDDVGAVISVRISYTDQHGTEEAVTSTATDAVRNVNDAPTGTVTVTDVSPEDNVLSVTHDLADEDGLGSFTYQWFRGAETIFGATFASYTMREGDIDADISVAVTYVDGFGTTERVFSSGDRAVLGTAGNDLLRGGRGIDTLSGGDGDDIYVFGPDFGTDLIQDSGGFDIIRLAEGITREDVRLWLNDFRGSNVDTFQVSLDFAYNRNGFINIGDDRIFPHHDGPFEGLQSIEEIHFSDGTILELSGPQHYQGSDLGESFTPHNNLNNTIEGGMGGDLLEGGTGDDTYIFNVGFGRSSVFNYGGDDVFEFGPGLSPSDMRISRENAYEFLLTFGEDQISMFDPGDPEDPWNAQYGVQTARFSDGTEIDLTGSLVMQGTDGDDYLSARQNDTVYGEAGNDRLDGGSLAAVLYGGAGDDTLNGRLGDDTLFGGSGTDVALFNDDSTNITVVSVTGGVLVTSADGTDFVATSVETFQFNDTSLTFAEIAALAPNVNVFPTGEVTITGTPTEDATLTAISTLADDNGLGTFTYQWMRDSKEIAGATSETYTLLQEDVGAEISVRISYVDQDGAPEAVTSAATSPVAAVNHAPTGTVTITGTATEGEILTAGQTLADTDGLGPLSYQWVRGTEDIGGALFETYTLSQADVGAQISVRVSYTDQRGNLETVSSAQTSTVSNVNNTPSGSVSIAGTAAENETLLAFVALTDVDGLGELSFQWLRGTEEIAGATSETYSLDQADVGAVISVRVSYTDQTGTDETVTSEQTSPVANVNDAPTGSVTIAGTATEDQTLTAVSTLADEDGLGPLSYQWLRGTEDIAGATSDTYTLGQQDVGATISVRVSHTDQEGTAEVVTSAATAAVANLNDAPTGSVSVTGTYIAGEVLTAGATLADADGLGNLSYQWLRGTVEITGANSTTYTLTQPDVGAAVSVRVSYTDQQGTNETVASSGSVVEANDQTVTGTEDDNRLQGGSGSDSLSGLDGNDTLIGGNGDDTLNGGDGSDVLNGGTGNDVIIGGATSADLRDNVYAGDGDDTIDGGYGNDELRGDAGNDSIAGGFGSDTVIGGTGDDTLTGSAFGDQIFGGAGRDFINGGFGHDLLNGGADADRFFHIGVLGHGSDWIQDYNAAEGDILQFGIGTATASQFQVNTTHTTSATGERSGDDNVEEAFIIYRPTGQIMWALVDGAGQSSINLQIGQEVFDLQAAANQPPVAVNDTLTHDVVSHEFALNSNTAQTQALANVLALSSGGFVASWHSNDGSDPSGYGIRTRSFDASGNPTLPETSVNSVHAGNQFAPKVAELDNGSLVYVWRGVDDATDGGAGTAATRVKIIHSNGTEVVEFTANEGTAGNQYSANIAALSGARFVLTWQTQDINADGSGSAIMARIFDANGTPSPEFLVNQGTFSDQLTPDVTTLSDGRFIVTWYGNAGTDPAVAAIPGDGIDHDGPGISARFFNADGTPGSNEFQVNSSFAGGQRSAKITELDNGNVLITWDTDDATQDGAGRAVMGRVFQPDGTAHTGEFLVNQNVNSGQSNADAVSLGNGTFVVVWTSNDRQNTGTDVDPSQSAIKGRLFNNDGSPAGNEFLVNENTEGSQLAPSVAALAEGGFVISWETNDAAVDTGGGVRARIYDNEGSPVVQGDFEANSATTIAAADILGNDTDADGDSLSIGTVDQTSANGGTVTLNGDGSVTYTPRLGFSGTDNFGYVVEDGRSGTDRGTVTLNVGPPTANTVANTKLGVLPDMNQLAIAPDLLLDISTTDEFDFSGSLNAPLNGGVAEEAIAQKTLPYGSDDLTDHVFIGSTVAHHSGQLIPLDDFSF